MRNIYTLHLWIARGSMALTVVFFFVAIYLMFFADPGMFAEGSLTPNSPLMSRLLFVGFVASMFFLGLAQHVVIHRKLNSMP